MGKTKELLIEIMRGDEELGLYEEPKRMYSKEEVKEAFRQGQDNMEYSEMFGLDSKLTEQQWFEQFKKR